MFDRIKYLQTTIPGLLVIFLVTVAWFKGYCNFNEWWMVIGYITGTALILTKGKPQ